MASRQETDESRSANQGSLLCFACSRCEYPLCVGADLIMTRIPGGTTDYAFEYDLDFLLDLDEPVPCYSGNEVVQTAIRVSEKVLNEQLPPAARVVALEAIIASRQFEEAQRHEMEARLHASPSAAAPTQAAVSSSPPRTASVGGEAEEATGHEHDQRLASRVDAPAARVTASGELVESDAEASEAPAAPVPPETSSASATTTARQHDAGTRDDAQGSAARVPLFRRPNGPIRHLGATSESRVDLVCTRTSLLATGLRLSLEDRSSDNPEPFTETAAALAAASAEDARLQQAQWEDVRHLLSSTTTGETTAAAASPAAPTSSREPTISATLSQVPPAVREAVLRPAPPTRWGDSPGNLSVEEAFMTVTRTTHTAQAPWFCAYTCSRRVECPDCHLPLGFLFVHHSGSSSSGGSETDASAHGDDTHSPAPALKKQRHEPSAAATEHNEEAEAEAVPEGESLPDFIALELKRIKQREWGLRDFQQRYEMAQHLDSFRALFPEAEELQSLYSRLTALRTQAELYSNLLRKHREQNDVQTALLQSQKQRMQTYEDKLSTMQHIIDAQRQQLDMQNTQLQHQQELLRSHRQQVSSQQQQIEVEQLLIAEQTKTIDTQREQIKLMRAHLNTRRLQDQLNEKKLELAERRQQAFPNGVPTFANPPTADTAADTNVHAERVPAAVRDSPPAHLRGIRDQGSRVVTPSPPSPPPLPSPRETSASGGKGE